jgi:hypothetical protein
VLGELPQASGDIYDDSTKYNNDGGDRQNNARITFGACSGFETN